LTLKSFLKSFKTNESTISMVLGALVIVIVGILTVNYFKDRRGQTLPEALTTTGVKKEHIVTKGESLWSIAEDYYGSGYNWVDLAKANSLSNFNLEVGQEISIPDIAAREPTATKKVVTAENLTSISGNSYTVVRGDNLWKIAVRAYGDGYKWVELAKINNLKNPDLIHSGNVLIIPR